MAENIAKEAYTASTLLKTLSNKDRSDALVTIHDALKSRKNEILVANKLDMNAAVSQKLSPSLIKRLDLSTSDKFDTMVQGVLDVAGLEDVVGKVTLAKELDENLNLFRVACPIGVLLIIFEARPEVIANITALAIKSGNAAILKGGKESFNTFKIMAEIVSSALSNTNVPAGAIQLISTREQVGDLLSQDKYIDLVIPRGSNELVRQIKSNTKIPVLGHADGICSIYVDEDADLAKAIKIAIDSKTTYPAGCNAAEQLLIHESLLSKQLPAIADALIATGVTLHATEEILEALPKSNKIVPAVDGDFDREFLSLDMAVKSVKSVDDAILHINLHSSKHTEAIITESKIAADKFLKGIDSSGVYWNASTRFADGFRYGFGTEVGISTNKIHARGPVGLEGLVGYQYQLRGNGHVVSDYIGSGGEKQYTHRDIDVKDLKL